jgi:hypothetical protein
MSPAAETYAPALVFMVSTAALSSEFTCTLTLLVTSGLLNVYVQVPPVLKVWLSFTANGARAPA